MGPAKSVKRVASMMNIDDTDESRSIGASSGRCWGMVLRQVGFIIARRLHY